MNITLLTLQAKPPTLSPTQGVSTSKLPLQLCAFEFSVYKCSLHWCVHLERRQPELVSAVLLSEDAEQEAVHAEQDAAPKEDSELLGARIGDTRDLECERNSREGEDTVCSWSVEVSRFTCSREYLHMAATIWLSRPNWLLKPPAK